MDESKKSHLFAKFSKLRSNCIIFYELLHHYGNQKLYQNFVSDHINIMLDNKNLSVKEFEALIKRESRKLLLWLAEHIDAYFGFDAEGRESLKRSDCQHDLSLINTTIMAAVDDMAFDAEVILSAVHNIENKDNLFCPPDSQRRSTAQ